MQQKRRYESFGAQSIATWFGSVDCTRRSASLRSPPTADIDETSDGRAAGTPPSVSPGDLQAFAHWDAEFGCAPSGGTHEAPLALPAPSAPVEINEEPPP